jgi:hypothetical protein
MTKKVIAFTAVVFGIIAEAVLWTLYIYINEYLDGLSSLGSTAFLYESDYMWFSAPLFIILSMVLLTYPIFIGILEFIPKEKNEIEHVRKEERCPHCGKKYTKR